METLKQRYDELEADVVQYLAFKLSESKRRSKHIESKAIKVNVFDYTELVEWSGKLIFLDKHGYHYDLFAECTIVDLLDIVEELRNA